MVKQLVGEEGQVVGGGAVDDPEEGFDAIMVIEEDDVVYFGVALSLFEPVDCVDWILANGSRSSGTKVKGVKLIEFAEYYGGKGA